MEVRAVDRKRQQGFTWIELMVALAIVGMLVAMAAPSLSRMSAEWRIRSVRDALLESVQQARAMALFGRTKVRICPNDAQRHCEPSSRDWQQGWSIEVERADKWSPWRIRQPLPRGIQAITLKRRTLPAFTPKGAASGTNLTIAICAPGKAVHAEVVRIAMSGRARSERATDEEIRHCVQKVAHFDEPDS